ncbi:hypothetical protein Q3W71_28555 [Micromonospora sp. C28SCA-DRY-2]|uniref:hypothetical protein n=1 Tax=Micromonospora sp. C28SCA-DRY-2 TaxID=3059522 RepID=UPI002674F0ED|nr:hypothetical protein [Micromonospora sp. C28SCA-DRY-2]MDO3705627.1 hypothetical protein [Micromonospora sp. C28SCA-DRY-2]
MVAVVLVAGLLAGCGTPPELRTASPGPVSTPGRTAAPAPTGTAPAPVGPTGLPGLGTPTPTTDPGLVAVACANGPTGARVIDLVRGRGGVLPRDVRVRVSSGPLCAAGWHYTILDVTGHEQLQVVTRGSGSAPRLVTAGTDVCTAEVRAAGPPGIRNLACEGGALGVPGA